MNRPWFGTARTARTRWPALRVNLAHPDGNTWIITGTSGNCCTLNRKKKLTLAGTVGPFEMTLVR